MERKVKLVLEISQETNNVLDEFRRVKSERFAKVLKSEVTAQIIEGSVPELLEKIEKMQIEMEQFKIENNS